MNTKDKWDTTVTIMDPARRALWIDVFPDAKLPIKSIMPEMAMIRGEPKLAYWMDLDALTDGQIDGLVNVAAKLFELDPVEVRMDMQQNGVAVPCKNTMAESTSFDALPDELFGDYPPPERNPKCQCKGNPMAQMFCMYGHMTECHYPMACDEAKCSHYQRDAGGIVDEFVDTEGDIP